MSTCCKPGWGFYPGPRPPPYPFTTPQPASPPKCGSWGWVVQQGYVRVPRVTGYPISSMITFWPRPQHMPRTPWPYESETRAAGTGLALGYAHRQDPVWVPTRCC